jgi:hypothetical protein
MNSDILFTFSRQTGDLKAHAVEFLVSSFESSPVTKWNFEAVFRTESPKFYNFEISNEVSELQTVNLELGA